MKVKIFAVILGLCIFCFAGFVAAEIETGSNYVQTSYGLGTNIVGWAEVGFNNESINLTTRDSFGNSISLQELFNLNSNYTYTYNQTTGIVNSSVQKIYFSNASFYVPLSPVTLNYQINISNVTVLSGQITISGSEQTIPDAIDEKRDDIANLSASFENYNTFLKLLLSSKLNLSEMEEEIDELETLYNSSESTSEYDFILESLQNLKVPKSISESESAELVSFISEKSNIDLEFVGEIGGGSYDSAKTDEYKDAIIFWNQENLRPKITFRKFTANYGSYEENILNYFEISFQRPSNETFLIIENLDGLEFKENYGEVSKSGYTYIDLSKIDEKIIFAATEEVSFDDIPLFFSTHLNQVPLGESLENILDIEDERKISKWVLFGLVMILLIILFIVSYFLLKTWYDRKYEDYLFKDRNHLYNLIVYINNAKKRGMKKEDIEKNLKKAKWKNEQIRYVVKKYAGKRTGLWAPSFSKQKVNSKKVNPKSHKN